VGRVGNIKLVISPGRVPAASPRLRHFDHGDLSTPPVLMAFDVLRIGERDYREEPLKVRRKALEKLVKGEALILPARR
jgi:ATP-dependent DNA ligase